MIAMIITFVGLRNDYKWQMWYRFIANTP
jgi:hypothetical protein